MPGQTEPAQLYLELLKRTLCFTLWPEPPAPVEWFDHGRPRWKRLALAAARRFLRRWNFRLVQPRPISPEDRAEGKFWPGYGHTMIGLKRLDNVQACMDAILREGIAGDFIETGVWRGGTCIFMRALLAARGITDRRVIAADSFRGLPPPDAARWPADRGDTYHQEAFFAVPRSEVEDNFRRFGLLDAQVVFLEGWFEDTLPRAPVERLALLRLDGDMYASTMVALEHLYPKLSPGGFCIIDDYSLPGCRQAVDDYRARQGVREPLVEIDWTGRYWRKSR